MILPRSPHLFTRLILIVSAVLLISILLVSLLLMLRVSGLRTADARDFRELLPEAVAREYPDLPRELVSVRRYHSLAVTAIVLSSITLIGLAAAIIVQVHLLIRDPLRRVQSATWEIYRGNYDARVIIVKPLEFEQFAEAFNRMAAEVQSKSQRIAAHSAELEQRVQKRTSALHDSLAQLEQAQETLIHQEKMASIGQLAAGVAHEVNNPIGYIRANLETLQAYLVSIRRVLAAYGEISRTAESPPESQLDRVRKLYRDLDIAAIDEDIDALISDSLRGASRITEIVRGLQTFAREDSSEMCSADLNTVAASALRVSYNHLKYHSTITENYQLDHEIVCNPNQVEQVLINLLVNAGDAVEAEGRITLSSGSDGGMAWVSVSDNGPGIPESVRRRVFEPFFTTKAAGKGTGLGLAISQQIAERHGGRLECVSHQGEGTRMTLYLPRSPRVALLRTSGQIEGEPKEEADTSGYHEEMPHDVVEGQLAPRIEDNANGIGKSSDNGPDEKTGRQHL